MTETAQVQTLPTADWVDPQELRLNPYPTYARLRKESPVAWVPAVRKVLITSFEGCVYGEQHPEIFSSHIEKADMIRAMNARPMIRKDDPEHAVERQMVNRTLRPKQVKDHWTAMFHKNTLQTLDELESQTGAADLNLHFARPLAARNLMDMIGFDNVDVESFARWSADLIAGSGNVLDDPEIWARCDRTRAEAHAALDDLLPRLRRQPNESMASHMLEHGAEDEVVRANIFLTISGGVNEPQHMMTSIALLLDQNPQQKPGSVESAPMWGAVFQEAARYFTPIGMVTRVTVQDSVVDGVEIPAGQQVGLMLASANRDETVFSNPDAFVSNRPEVRHLAFGSGTHMCAGKWAAEAAVGQVAMPALYQRFPDLHVDTARPVTWDGWAFRGMTSLPVSW